MTNSGNAPLKEWPRKRLERHREMLEKKQAEIQGRIDAIEMVLDEREHE